MTPDGSDERDSTSLKGEQMPRGIRKLGQHDFTIWLPTGGRLQVKTTGDLSGMAFVSATRETIRMMDRLVESYEKELADDNQPSKAERAVTPAASAAK